jgi:hypothetical protein
MKTKILLCSMLALSTMMMKVNAQVAEQTNKTVYQLSAVPTIDGVADETWNAVPWDTLTAVVSASGDEILQSDLLVRVKLGWKGNNFYALIDRQDDTLSFNLTKSAYQQDYISFYINFAGYDAVDGSYPTHPKAFYARSSFNPNVANGGAADTAVTDGHHFSATDNQEWRNNWNHFKNVAKMKYVVTGNNVLSEWSMVTGIAGFSDGITLADAKQLGFELEIGDVDKLTAGRKSQAFWNAAGNDAVYNNLTKIGIATLSSEILVTGINTRTAKETVSFYPNPAKDIVNIKSATNATRVTVMNALGQVVLNQSVVNKSVNISGLNTGLYMVNVYNGNKLVATSRIVKK